MGEEVDSQLLEAARVVERECFWGDYRLTASQILDRLGEGDEGFRRFVFSKIVDNSSHPSRFLRVLLDPAHLRRFLDEAVPLANGRRAERLRIIERNLFRTGSELKAYAWSR